MSIATSVLAAGRLDDAVAVGKYSRSLFTQWRYFDWVKGKVTTLC